MKKYVLLIIILCVSYSVIAQNKYSPFYNQKVSLFDQLPIDSDDIVFLGNSITDNAEWTELLNDIRVKNRGIGGDSTDGVYDRLDQIVNGKPAKIFMMIGINDMANGLSAEDIILNIEKIVKKIKKETPSTQLYLQSILPISDHFEMFPKHMSKSYMIPQVNEAIKSIANKEGATYIDLFSHFKESESDRLNIEYSNDGLHLIGTGYKKWIEIIRPYVDEE